MKFQAFFLSVILALFPVTQAVHIRGFTRLGCRGHQWICWNIPPGTCCRFKVPIRSERWTLPHETRGIAYYKQGCNGAWPAVLGPRYNSCWDYYQQPIRSTKWQQGYCVWQWKRWFLEPRQDQCMVDGTGCVDPNVVVYVDSEGTERVISFLPEQGDQVVELLDNNDYDSLRALFRNDTGELDLSPSVDNYTLYDNGTAL